VNAAQVVTCAGPARARRGAEMRDAGILRNTALAVSNGRIAAIGAARDLKDAYAGAEVVDCRGGVLTPGLVDSHTHAVFGKARFEEHELRAEGYDYMEIAKRGGGIHASVRDFRDRSEDELYDLAVARVQELASYGTTTLEIKSGYGLTVEDELKALRVIGRLAARLPMRIVATWLGGHEIPQEYRSSEERRAEFVDLLTKEMPPKVVEQGIARFADVFCEPGVFTIDETRRILEASRKAGLGIKLHADELKPCGGAELAASLSAVSADHLGAISEKGIAALAKSDTVATLLPGTMLFLGKAKQAPARALIDAGAAVALATDFNPGPRELIGEHQPDVVLARAEVGELLERLERVGILPRAVHPVGVLEKILLGVAVEALLGRDLSELVVDLVSGRRVAEDLVAERYRVVEVAAFRIKIDGLLVVVDRLIGLVQPQIEVADPVIDRDVAVLQALGLSDDLKIDLESPVELLFLLEFGSLFFVLVDVGH